MREPVGSRGLGSLTAGSGPGVGWQAAEVGWGGRQWPLSDGMEPWPGLHVNSESRDNHGDNCMTVNSESPYTQASEFIITFRTRKNRSPPPE